MENQMKNTIVGFSAEFTKTVANYIGITDLTYENAEIIAADVTHNVVFILQDAMKFMAHGKRDLLATDDIDYALKLHNTAPTYGFNSYDRCLVGLSSGVKVDTTMDDKKKMLNLQDFMTNFSPKLCPAISLKLHWIAINGIEPVIPENPSPLTFTVQQSESANPTLKLQHEESDREIIAKPSTSNAQAVNTIINAKKPALSKELNASQLFIYKDIIESCIGADEERRSKALSHLIADKGLDKIISHLCTYILEGVKLNLTQLNLSGLIYLMRMVNAIADNKNIHLEKYAHELLPAIITCIVSQQLSPNPEYDNHWLLRNYASRLLSVICKSINTDVNNIQTRTMRIFSRNMTKQNIELATLYGCIVGLTELSGKLVNSTLMSNILFFSQKLERYLENGSTSNTDSVSARHVQDYLLKILPPIIIERRKPPDVLSDYIKDYGYLGRDLHAAVTIMRN